MTTATLDREIAEDAGDVMARHILGQGPTFFGYRWKGDEVVKYLATHYGIEATSEPVESWACRVAISKPLKTTA